jgi:hypothetical protein
MKKALVLIHLSSLDSYVVQYGMEQATQLALRMRAAVLNHDGPVYIVDQRWPFSEPHSIPRHEFVISIQLARDINWIHWDEWNSWEDFLSDLRGQLKRDGVNQIVLGGVWYDPSLEAGCVSETYLYLKNFFLVIIDPSLVGCIPTAA